MPRLLSLAGFSLALLTVACGGNEQEGVGGASSSSATSSSTGAGAGAGAGGGGSGGGAAGIVWGPCPEGFANECATVKVPLDWSKPEGETIDVFVARQRAGVDGAPMLWLLQGGPGGSVDAFTPLLPELTARLPGFDFYAFEHRGVGHSTRLGCPTYEKASSDAGTAVTFAEWPDCVAELKAKWGDDLQQFTTSNAARDLGNLIDRTRSPGQQAFVYGVSYGTYWTQRYLQLFPDQPTGVVIDSIVSPGVQFLSDFDKQWDPVGDAFLADCAADAGCTAKMTSDPLAFVASVFDAVDAGQCAELGADRALLRQIMSALIAQWFTRPYALGLIYRINRCDPADVDAIVHMYDTLFVPPPGPLLDSDALFFNVAFSEIWPKQQPSITDLQAIVDASYFAPGTIPEDEMLYPLWPRYPQDKYVGAFATSKVPILMLNGTLDPQTPIDVASVAKQHYTAAHQTFVTIPNAAHATIEEAPDVDPNKSSCGMQVMASYLKAPTKAPDVSCLGTLLPISFDSYPTTNVTVWGTSDMWDNPPAPIAPTHVDPIDERASRAIKRDRRRTPLRY